MQNDPTDVMWLSHWQTLSLGELAGCCGMPETDLVELMAYGALVPLDMQASEPAFAADCVFTIRKAQQLRADLELDLGSMALAIALLARIDVLESDLRLLRARLSN